MPPTTPKLLHDLRRACTLIRAFIAGKTFEDYVPDALLKAGVEREFLIIGEALNRLSKSDPETAAQISDTRRIVAFRNILAHGYDIVSDEVVWGLLEGHLARLESEIDGLLAKSDSDELADA